MIKLCTMNSCDSCFNVMKLKWHLLQAVAVEHLAVIHDWSELQVAARSAEHHH